MRCDTTSLDTTSFDTAVLLRTVVARRYAGTRAFTAARDRGARNVEFCKVYPIPQGRPRSGALIWVKFTIAPIWPCW